MVEVSGGGKDVEFEGSDRPSEVDCGIGTVAGSANFVIGVWALLPRRDTCSEAVVVFSANQASSPNHANLKMASLKCAGRKSRGSQGLLRREIVFPIETLPLDLVIVCNCC